MMDRIIKDVEILIYYDGPELFIGTDQINTKYICLFVEETDQNERYLCSAISPLRLNYLLSGEEDLRSIFKKPEVDGLYLMESLTDSSFSSLRLIDINSIKEEWYPDENFFYRHSAKHDERILDEAKEKKRAIIHLSLSPPESLNEPKINATLLGKAINVFQALLKYSYKKAIENLQPEFKKSIDLTDNYEVEVFSFSPGSFKIEMQSKTIADFFGYNHLTKALLKIDEIIEPIEDSEKTIGILKKNTGHLIKVYKDFIKLAIDYDSNISYEWCTPEIETTNRNSFTKGIAEPIYEILSKSNELQVESIKIIGRIIRADVINGRWKLFEEGSSNVFQGKISKESNISLAGVTIETKLYELLCEEHLVEDFITGKERPILLLKEYKEL